MHTCLIVLLVLLIVILSIVGIIGAIAPALPGPPLCWLALLVCFVAFPAQCSATVLWVMLALTFVTLILDYVAPVWMTKMGGGSKAAIRGSTAGLIVGLFFMPAGLILGPLVGAFVGEMLSTQQMGQALRVAILSFVSFLLTTGLKLVCCLLISFYSFTAVWHALF